ncbi:hypothetical protein WJX74_000505 [Apatococcus lobatus]|uniref:Uncharacterized protein n=1 Tax=Apatococcus lobatus TaxID=904363 RepID=A0AAW1QHG8_9CHLO
MDTQGIQICLLELPFSQALSKDMSNEAVDTIAADVADLPGTIADKANFILSMRTAFDLDQAAWRLLLRRLPASLQQEVGDQINQGTSGPPGPSGQGPLTLRKMAATLGEEHLKLAACAFSSDHLRTHQGGQDHLSGDAAARTCSGVGQAREVITMDILMPNEVLHLPAHWKRGLAVGPAEPTHDLLECMPNSGEWAALGALPQRAAG